MSMVEDFNKVGDNFLVHLLSLLLLLAPGVGVMYFFKPDLLLTLDVFKLALLSLVFVVPMFLMLLLPMIVLFNSISKEVPIIGCAIISLFLENSVMFSWILLSQLLGLSLSSYIIACLITNTALLLLTIIIIGLFKRAGLIWPNTSSSKK